jgi:hypothetical protein
LIVRPSSEPEGVTPGSDSGKEMALGVLNKSSWFKVFYRAIFNIAGGDSIHVYELAHPLCCEAVNLVIKGGHDLAPNNSS